MAEGLTRRFVKYTDETDPVRKPELPPSASQEDPGQQELSPQDDLPPKLTRKSSKYVHDKQSNDSVAPNTPSSESFGKYPVRGTLSVNLRAQDCTSGIYDTPPSGPPKKVKEHNENNKET
ncbi:hypothetical protein E2C01_090411 [Portunus trituberculatus]|uniref:Uncharacterized protein n=1 Tax=Portunus trituberculatus TaxID=210409 RepID=A0A5B7JEM2_PORTR|nr:hypothetical protein [Portunus trituberculatus]